MSKRGETKFDPIDGEYYPTVDRKSFRSLVPMLSAGTRFYEPCAGAGHLISGLAEHGIICIGASDADPKNDFIDTKDALALTGQDLGRADYIITNPPHSAPLVFDLIEHLRKLLPTWVLVPLDKLATAQAVSLMRFCSAIVVIGRLNWIAGTKTGGKDNFVWALFQADERETRFINSSAAWASLSRKEIAK